jgi:ribbon-helix-helix CopG family protein
VKRTTIMAEESTLERLRALARERGVSFAEVTREALAQKAEEYRPRPKSLGSGQSGKLSVSDHAGVVRTETRSWR